MIKKKNERDTFLVLRRVFSFFGSYRKIFAVGFLLSSLEFLTSLLMPEFNRQLVQIVSDGEDQTIINSLILIFVLLFLLAPFIALGKYLQGISCAHGVRSLREAAFANLQNCKTQEEEKFRMGDIITRLTGDIDTAGYAFQSFAFTALARFIVVLCASMVMLVMVDIRIALLALCYCLCTLFLSSRMNPYVRKLDQAARVEVSSSTNYLLEAVKNQFVIRIYLLQSILKTRYQEHCKIIRKKRVKFQITNGLTYGILDILTFSAPIVGFLLAFFLYLQEDKDFSSAVYIASLFGIMGDATLYGGTFVLLIQPTVVAAKRVFALFELPTEKVVKSVREMNLQSEEILQITNLNFSYNDRKVLENIHLEIKKGENIAIVGGSGSGKSTLAKLIAGLLLIPHGTIKYGGVLSENLSLTDIRAMTSYIPQEYTILPGNIRQNIHYGKLEAAEDEVVKAAEVAGIHEFVQSLPQGYETEIGEYGERVSGGQRQRLAIARAVIKNAPLFILDEATAALDSQTEENILQGLDVFDNSEITTITIAHRLSTVQHAHRIIVMDKGMIAEVGTHVELLVRNEKYAKLWNQTCERS